MTEGIFGLGIIDGALLKNSKVEEKNRKLLGVFVATPEELRTFRRGMLTSALTIAAFSLLR
jgi:hypothetical protein